MRGETSDAGGLRWARGIALGEEDGGGGNAGVVGGRRSLRRAFPIRSGLSNSSYLVDDRGADGAEVDGGVSGRMRRWRCAERDDSGGDDGGDGNDDDDDDDDDDNDDDDDERCDESSEWEYEYEYE